ncbi:hypothetical protein GGX14DRAFT_639167 [Mycena pura]|uniref:Uncharacterized protein n=1 Tax=Mycena pura TaxID=153505 RepID=A0AAD6YPS2_9AGAR|nr:hypothetical protein GGX14DRAFT_639167 [Mycena pura]
MHGTGDPGLDKGDVGERDGGVGMGDIIADDAIEEERECLIAMGIGDAVKEAVEEEGECGGVGNGDITSDAIEEERECDGDPWRRSELRSRWDDADGGNTRFVGERGGLMGLLGNCISIRPTDGEDSAGKFSVKLEGDGKPRSRARARGSDALGGKKFGGCGGGVRGEGGMASARAGFECDLQRVSCELPGKHIELFIVVEEEDGAWGLAGREG